MAVNYLKVCFKLGLIVQATARSKIFLIGFMLPRVTLIIDLHVVAYISSQLSTKLKRKKPTEIALISSSIV